MEDFNSKDFFKLISQDVKSAFEKYKLKNKRPKVKIVTALWIIPAILIHIMIIVFFFSWILASYFGIQVAVWMFLISIPLFIAAITMTSSISRIKHDYVARFIKGFNISKYYKLEMDRLFGDYLTDFSFKKSFLTSVLKLRPFAFSKRSRVREVMTFSLEGQKFSYGVVSTLIPSQGNSHINRYIGQTFIVANFTKNFLESPTNMYFAKDPFLLLDDAKKIDFESPEFNNYANVFSSDQIAARKFINPKRMLNILEMSRKNNRAKPEYLFFHKYSLIGEFRTFRSKHDEDHDFTSLEFVETLDEVVGQIYNKVKNEVSDLHDALKFFQIMGLFPD
ncbi:DUF3137 domain-containing protein [Spiroplasma alleghenense]|uniref:DUF3137 domain-containing protein n=1 Tax=Spiroplasma alleghenense TaxID=216931 RepID=A0A345Z2Q9_9MOLU|nr:DUF3137 domain-containing protein [Spiroplasma alleghenense]AXK50888.1 hypothetical protein SALLE_v1c02120 [Spiroplasma alleghenense]